MAETHIPVRPTYSTESPSRRTPRREPPRKESSRKESPRQHTSDDVDPDMKRVMEDQYKAVNNTHLPTKEEQSPPEVSKSVSWVVIIFAVIIIALIIAITWLVLKTHKKDSDLQEVIEPPLRPRYYKPNKRQEFISRERIEPRPRNPPVQKKRVSFSQRNPIIKKQSEKIEKPRDDEVEKQSDKEADVEVEEQSDKEAGVEVEEQSDKEADDQSSEKVERRHRVSREADLDETETKYSKGTLCEPKNEIAKECELFEVLEGNNRKYAKKKKNAGKSVSKGAKEEEDMISNYYNEVQDSDEDEYEADM